MSTYLHHLQDAYSVTTFQRKYDYIRYNVAPLLGKINNRSAILEIGPGMGELVKYFNDQGVKDIDIVDNDLGVLKYVEGKFRVRTALRTDDISKIQSKLKKYDAIVLIQVMEHIPPTQYYSFLNLLFNLLKPNGKIIIVVPNANNPLGLVERYGDLQHYNAFTTRSLYDLVQVGKLINAGVQVRGFWIPPYSVINMVRIFVQKLVHLFLFCLLIGNGGTYFPILSPNIMLVISKESSHSATPE